MKSFVFQFHLSYFRAFSYLSSEEVAKVVISDEARAERNAYLRVESKEQRQSEGS